MTNFTSMDSKLLPVSEKIASNSSIDVKIAFCPIEP